MLKIRMQRIGKKGHPIYRIIVSEKARDTQAGSLEILGFYNPSSKVKELEVERIKYWLEKGAQPSATLNNFFINEKIITGKKQKSVYLTGKRKEKIAKKKAETAPKE